MTFDKDRAAAVREAILETTITIQGTPLRPAAPEPLRTGLLKHLTDLLELERNLLGWVDEAGNLAAGEALHAELRLQPFERLRQLATENLDEAMEIVQKNSDYFGAKVGDDKIKVVGEFFVKWWKEKQVRP